MFFLKLSTGESFFFVLDYFLDRERKKIVSIHADGSAAQLALTRTRHNSKVNISIHD